MNNFEENLKIVMKKEINKPNSYEYAIKNAFNNYNEFEFNNWARRVATVAFCLIVGMTGIITGVYIGVEKVWKEPKKIDISNLVNENPTEDVIPEIVNNSSIENKISDFLNIIGINNIQEYQLELKSMYPKSDKQYYMYRTNLHDYNKGIIIIAEENGNITYFYNNDFETENKSLDTVNKDDAINKSETLLKSLDIFSNDYQLIRINQENDIWRLTYAKKNENNIINKNDEYDIVFGIKDGNIKLKRLSNYKDSSYENNDLIISKDDAIKIVEEKEKTFNGSNFKIVSCELGIEKMNTYIYKLENNISDLEIQNYYRVDDISRNVWIVKIEHEKENSIIEFESTENYKKYANKYYYVDVTTGEIIGGKNDFDEIRR